MKRIFVAVVACALAFSVAGCTAKSKDVSGEQAVSGSVSQTEQNEEGQSNPQMPSTITYESLDDMPE